MAFLRLFITSFAVPFYGLALYTYYHGIVQHSGIVFKARWWQPWQPDCMFHDNHHQYCHVNYGFNCFVWDKVSRGFGLKICIIFIMKIRRQVKNNFFFLQIHGSMRRVDRCYSERTDPWGLGRPLVGLSDGELRHEIQERVAENPIAYRENINPYSM